MEPGAPHKQDDDHATVTRVIRGGSATSATVDSVRTRTRLGRFELREVLGEGGMGVVYRAVDDVLSREVAIKMMRGTPSGNGRTRLLREAQAMAKLSHPNLVTIYEAGIEGEDVYLCMELVRGRSLSQWLRQQPRSTSEILRVFIAAGRGLEAAHAAGIVHRDFKPSNVLIADDGAVQVTDFGIALVDGAADTGDVSSVDVRMTQTGVALGTPLYMSPEQHEAKQVDPRTDQFSFAISLAEAVYGEPPFAGESRAELAAAVSTREPRLPDNKAPAGLKRALRRALERAPGDRYPSMTELLADLAALLAEPRRRRWGVAAAAAATAVGAVAVGILLLGRGAGETDTPAPASLVAPTDAAALERAAPFDAGAAISADATMATAASDAAPATKKPPARTKPPRKVDEPETDVAPMETPPRTIGKWRYSNDRCARYPATKRCGSCCLHGKKLMPYPNCGCYFDAQEFERTRGGR